MCILDKGFLHDGIFCKLTFQINLFCISVKILLIRTGVNHCVFQVGPCKSMSFVHCTAEL